MLLSMNILYVIYKEYITTWYSCVYYSRITLPILLPFNVSVFIENDRRFRSCFYGVLDRRLTFLHNTFVFIRKEIDE
jgi:hypothetical protein